MTRLSNRITRRMNRMLARKDGNVGDVILRWRTKSGAPVDADPHLEVSWADTAWQEASETKRAFIHEVGIHGTGFTRHSEVKVGDLILDFMGDVQIDGREELQFEIDGQLYVQKNGGDELAKSWNVRCGGVNITRTLLVTLKS